MLLQGYCGIGGGRSDVDRGAGPGLPVLGDDVELGFGAVILGPILVGDRVRVGPRTILTRDVPDDTDVWPGETRRRRLGDATAEVGRMDA